MPGPRHVGRSDSYLPIHYEALADDIYGELARFFDFLDVTPVALAELRQYFDQWWHFMGNSSLFGFDGLIRRGEYELGLGPERWMRRIAGVPWEPL